MLNKSIGVDFDDFDDSIQLGGFQRDLLRFETICYTSCACDDSCENNDSCACDGSCENNDSCENNGSCSCDACTLGYCSGSCGCDNSYDCDAGYDCDTSCECDAGYDCDTSCECDDGCIDHYHECNFTSSAYDMMVNWDNLLYDNSQLTQEIESSIDITSQTGIDGTIEANVVITADYKVAAKYPTLFGNDNAFGFSYIIDTFSFSDNGRTLLQDSNPCENRVSSAFTNQNVSKFWNYTIYPSDPSKLGNNNFLEYPDPNIWSIIMEEPDTHPCGKVEWSHTFTFSELIDECGFKWIDNDNDGTFDLYGNFYLTAISPNLLDYDEVADTGSYFMKTLITQPLLIKFQKASTLVNSAFVDLFGNNIISVKHGNNDINQTKEMEIILFTYVPNWMKLDDTSSFKSLLQPTIASIGYDQVTDGIITLNELSQYYYNDDCYVLDSYRCWQKWQILFEFDNGDICSSPSASLDISSNYTFQTEFLCLSGQDNVCDDFTSGTHDYEMQLVTLDTKHLSYAISCEATIETLNIEGSLEFYQDASFNKTRNTIIEPYLADGDQTVYIQISLDNIGSDNDDTYYDVLGFEVSGLYLCTGDVISPAAMDTSDGCLENDNSIFIVSELYDILIDSSLNYQLLSANDDSDSIDSFSFLLPEIDDQQFWISANVILTLSDVFVSKRRVLLQLNGGDTGDSNENDDSSFNYYENVNGVAYTDYVAPIDDGDNSETGIGSEEGSEIVEIIIIGSIIFVAILTIAIVIVCCLMLKKKVNVEKQMKSNMLERVTSTESQMETPAN